MRWSRLWPHLLAGTVLVALAGLYETPVLNDLPFGVHAWAQGDRLAIAQRFAEDGLSHPLDPKARSLFPTDGRVNAELPVTSWLAAAAARVAGGKGLVPACRLVTLLLSLLGPYALFLYTYRHTSSLLLGLVPMAFLATSPVWAYYAGSFLPDGPALGLFLLGACVSWGSRGAVRERNLLAAVAVWTLAALIKTSFAVYVGAFALVLLIRELGQLDVRSVLGVLKRHRLAVTAFSGMCVVLCGEVGNLAFRRWAYGPTFFTTSVEPISSLEGVRRVVVRTASYWRGDLFTPVQLVLLVAGMVIMVAGRRAEDRSMRRILLAFAVPAAVLFFLFGSQLYWHDYYFLAILYPIAGVLVVGLAVGIGTRLPGGRRALTRVAVVVALLAVGLMTFQGLQVQHRRTSEYFRRQTAWLGSARRLVDGAGVGAREPVAVMGSIPPNLALVYLGRNGYVLGEKPGDAPYLQLRFPTFRQVRSFMRSRGVRILVVRGGVDGGLSVAARAAGFEVLAESRRAVVLVVAGRSARGSNQAMVPSLGRSRALRTRRQLAMNSSSWNRLTIASTAPLSSAVRVLRHARVGS